MGRGRGHEACHAGHYISEAFDFHPHAYGRAILSIIVGRTMQNKLVKALYPVPFGVRDCAM